MVLSSPSARCWGNRSPSKQKPSQLGSELVLLCGELVGNAADLHLARTFPSARCLATVNLGHIGPSQVAKGDRESTGPGCGERIHDSSRRWFRWRIALAQLRSNMPQTISRKTMTAQYICPASPCGNRTPSRRPSMRDFARRGAPSRRIVIAAPQLIQHAEAVAPMACLCRTVFMDRRQVSTSPNTKRGVSCKISFTSSQKHSQHTDAKS